MWQWLAVGARSQTVLSPGRAPSGFPTRRVTHRRTRSLAQRRRTQDFPSPCAQGARFPSALPSAVRGKKLLCPFHPLGLGSTKQLFGLAHPAERRKQGLGSSFVLSLRCWAPGGPGCPMTGHPAAMCHQGCIHCGHWLLRLRSSTAACPLPSGFGDGFRAAEVVLSCSRWYILPLQLPGREAAAHLSHGNVSVSSVPCGALGHLCQ